MKKIVIIISVFIHFYIFSSDNTPINNIYITNNFAYSNLKTENPFRNISNDWLKEDLRLEKLIIAIGVITLAAGFPLLLTGVLNITNPNVDTPETSLNTFYALTGVGGGLLFVGTCITIGGSVAFGINRKKLKVSFLIFK